MAKKFANGSAEFRHQKYAEDLEYVWQELQRRTPWVLVTKNDSLFFCVEQIAAEFRNEQYAEVQEEDPAGSSRFSVKG